jgi:hypothetical protein
MRRAADRLDAGGTPPVPGGGFFASRWRGQAAIGRLFWTDMALVGTLVNVAAGFAAIMLIGLTLPAWIAVAIFLAPLPYNVFLVMAVWRATEGMAGNAASGYRTGALIWLALVFLI